MWYCMFSIMYIFKRLKEMKFIDSRLHRPPQNISITNFIQIIKISRLQALLT